MKPLSILYYYDVAQGSEEWFSLRLGILTASNVKHILSPTFKIANNEKTRSLAYELAAQRETKILEDGFLSWDMERGHIEEDFARQLYSKERSPVTQCGFIINESLGVPFGYSPDGLVGEDGLIEVKSRNQKYQIMTICAKEVPAEYVLQIQAGLLVSNRKWCDFISYSNGMPMYIERVYPDLFIQDKIMDASNNFEMSVIEIQAAYRENSIGLIKTQYVDHSLTIITPSNEVA